MIRFASASGLTIPPLAVESVRVGTSADEQEAEQGDALRTDYRISADRLVKAHRQLARVIAPATPRTILLLEQEKPQGGLWRLLGPIRLVRQMMVFAIVSLLGFIALVSLTPVAQQTSADPLFAANDLGWPALARAAFLLSAAGMGAAFGGLFKANRYIAEGSFDQKYEASYWITVVLGLIAGIVLAQILPDNTQSLGKLTKPLLALLGGFSAPAVYRVLERLVQTIEALIQGDAREEVRAQQREAKAHAATEILNSRMAIATKALKVQGQIYKEKDIPDAAKERVGKLLDDLLPADGTGDMEVS